MSKPHAGEPAQNSKGSRLSVSVIIPALNEAALISSCLASVQSALPRAEIIVVDGGSADGTPAIARAAGARALSSARGRGPQCNAGAMAASGELLLFLHADTSLPPEGGERLREKFREPGADLATFRLSFDVRHFLLSFYAWFSRFDLVCTKFGDGGIAVRREFFEALGGFPPWAMFEDVEFLRRARRRTRIHILPAAVTTSARRFVADGVVRRQLFNGLLLLRFLLGGSVDKIAGQYGGLRPARRTWARLLRRVRALPRK